MQESRASHESWWWRLKPWQAAIRKVRIHSIHQLVARMTLGRCCLGMLPHSHTGTGWGKWWWFFWGPMTDRDIEVVKPSDFFYFFHGVPNPCRNSSCTQTHNLTHTPCLVDIFIGSRSNLCKVSLLPVHQARTQQKQTESQREQIAFLNCSDRVLFLLY